MAYHGISKSSLNLSYHPRLRLEDPVQELARAQGVAARLQPEREHGVGEHLGEDVGQPARRHDPQVPRKAPLPPAVAAPRGGKAPSPVVLLREGKERLAAPALSGREELESGHGARLKFRNESFPISNVQPLLNGLNASIVIRGGVRF